ncbi:MAG: 16S rRNA (cytidine(1402)-2'-O)-methyltransferase, partial [Anaerolineaceae bacterium]|nr:16S rRNA (cytidine(1402)-2'-O)-methyltransferase [Anaerolineaceae bacterium]
MLYLVATPIGNLGDITYRAVQVLKAVDLIASEDSRKTSILLKHYDIVKPQIAINNFNERKVIPRIIGKLEQGETIALVTDAGTPSISDPGYLLTHAALDAGIEVVSIPGPSAVVTALTVADLPLHSFTFKGFPPNKEGPRKRFIAMEAESPHTLVFYESPYRIIAFLKNCQEVLGDRNAVVANDMTKK